MLAPLISIITVQTFRLKKFFFVIEICRLIYNNQICILKDASAYGVQSVTPFGPTLDTHTNTIYLSNDINSDRMYLNYRPN